MPATTEPLELTLPYPPTANTYWRHVGAKTLLSAKGRAYKVNVYARLMPLRLRPITGRLWMEVDVYPPDNRRRDIDNLQKALWDSMKGLVYLDDSQVDDFRVVRREVVRGGKVVVRVREIEP